MPLAPAIEPTQDNLVGFSMRYFEKWLPLASLKYDPNARSFQRENGFQFTDNTAVQAIQRMFAVLAGLARRHIAIGDISMKNILIDPNTGSPGFIDLDSVHLEDFESASGGTEGYTDPYLLEMDANSEGGLNFDPKSDVFALTVVAFELLFGIMPHMVPTTPTLRNLDEYVKRGISLIRVLRQGTSFLTRERLQLADRDYVAYIKERIDELAKVAGPSGHDGETIIGHFEDVFINQQRENLIERLIGDEFDPIDAILIRTGGQQAIVTLARIFGLPEKQPSAPKARTLAIEMPRSTRRFVPFISRDPRSLAPFATLRGIDVQAMVS